jgi:hypothetical protein
MTDRQHGFSAGLWAIGLGIILVLIGCASPGVPKPPALKLPELPKKVTAERVGDEVTLRWTTPSETTDHLKVKGPVTAVICREQPSRKRGEGACVPVDKKMVVAGAPVEVVEKISVELAGGDIHSLTYRVELQNESGRSAGWSEPAWTASGPAPGSVEALTVASRREGALVRWRPRTDEGWVEVKRLRLDPEKPKPATAKPGNKPMETAVVLRAGTGGMAPGKTPQTDADKGGMVDTGVQRAAHYQYTAQRVRQVTVGGRNVLIRGIESAAVSFMPRDTFAPSAPTGVVAVPGSGSIDLSWAAGEEPDLAGYNVYRSVGDGAEAKLTSEPVTGPAFRDMAVTAGIGYSYRITAVDANGNESERSGAVREMGR